MTRYLILVRHGTTGEESAGKFIGQTDVPMNESGERQSLRLRESLNGWRIDAAFCSDLLRTRQTAMIAMSGKGLAIIPRRDLREAGMGVWEGRTRKDIAKEFPEEYAARGLDIANYRIEGGETFAECQARVVQALQTILDATKGNVLVVAHANTNRLALCHMLKLPISDMFKLGQDNACINLVAVNDGNYRLLLLNYTGGIPIPEGEKNAGRVPGQQRYRAGLAAGSRSHDQPIYGRFRKPIVTLPPGTRR